MKNLIIVFLFSFSFVLNAQNKHANLVKAACKDGLSFLYNIEIEQNIDAWIKEKNSKTSEILSKHLKIEPILINELKLNGLPTFLKWIPAANTGLDPKFQSSNNGSKGIWPLEFSIAKKYELTMNSFEDDRFDPAKSAEAACMYLKSLFVIYKDWQKVILAFKIGLVRTNYLLREYQTTDFSVLYTHLSAEEKEPIHQFYAALAVLSNYKSLDVPFVTSNITLDTASATLPIKFKLIEEFTKLPTYDLLLANPQLLNNAIGAIKDKSTFFIPKAYKKAYNLNKDTLHTLTRYEIFPPIIFDTFIKIVDSIEYISLERRNLIYRDFSAGKRTITSITITPRDTVFVDSVMYIIKRGSPIPNSKKPKVKTETVKNKETTTNQKEKENLVKEEPIKKEIAKKEELKDKNEKLVTVTYIVKKKDGLYTLSDIFDCEIKEILKWNNLKSNGIFIGQNLIFKVPASKLKYYKKMNSLSADAKKEIASKD